MLDRKDVEASMPCVEVFFDIEQTSCVREAVAPKGSYGSGLLLPDGEDRVSVKHGKEG